VVRARTPYKNVARWRQFYRPHKKYPKAYVVYFNQQMVASHAVCWLKLLSHLFPLTDRNLMEDEQKMRKHSFLGVPTHV
jgi:hypothetical protein